MKTMVLAGGLGTRLAEPLPVHGDDKNVRDWIHVEDHCTAVETELDKGIDGKIERELGWRATRSLEEGLESTISWYRTHEQWWRSVKSGEYRNWYERKYGQRGTQ